MKNLKLFGLSFLSVLVLTLMVWGAICCVNIYRFPMGDGLWAKVGMPALTLGLAAVAVILSAAIYNYSFGTLCFTREEWSAKKTSDVSVLAAIFTPLTFVAMGASLFAYAFVWTLVMVCKGSAGAAKLLWGGLKLVGKGIAKLVNAILNLGYDLGDSMVS